MSHGYTWKCLSASQDETVATDRPSPCRVVGGFEMPVASWTKTLVVVAGEFGRTPKISLLAQHYNVAWPRSLGSRCKVFWWLEAEPVTVLSWERRMPSELSRLSVLSHLRSLPRRSTMRLGSQRKRIGATLEERPHQVYFGTPIAELF